MCDRLKMWWRHCVDRVKMHLLYVRVRWFVMSQFWVSDATCECASVTADVMGCCGEMSIGCALCVCVSNATRECGLDCVRLQ